jgi:hypothetical protein
MSSESQDGPSKVHPGETSVEKIGIVERGPIDLLLHRKKEGDTSQRSQHARMAVRIDAQCTHPDRH